MKTIQNRQPGLSIGSKNVWLSVLPAVFFLANLYRMTGHSTMPYIGVMIAVGTAGWLFLLLRGRVRTVLLLFLGLYFFTLVINCLIIGNIAPSDIVSDALLWGITFLMIFLPCSYGQGFVQFYITAAVFAYYYLTTGGSTHSILTSSGNYISILLIISASLYYSALQYSGRRIKLYDALPAGICFFFSVWGKGRGGILASGIFLALILIVTIRETVSSTTMKVLLLTLVFIGVVAMLVSESGSLLDWFFQLGKWKKRGTDNSARELIWGEYFGKVKESLVYFLCGAPLKDIPVIAEAGGNCHNSFIQLHAYNGILTVIGLLVMLWKAVRHYFRHKQWLLLIVLGVFCLRAFTDKFIFGQYGMPVLLFLVLGPFLNPVPGTAAAGKKEGKKITASAAKPSVAEG